MSEKQTLSGGKLAGGNPENGRVENDYYATNPKAVEMFPDSLPSGPKSWSKAQF